MVGERGFEPPTPWSRTRCSTRLSHSPTVGSGHGRNALAYLQNVLAMLAQNYSTPRFAGLAPTRWAAHTPVASASSASSVGANSEPRAWCENLSRSCVFVPARMLHECWPLPQAACSPRRKNCSSPLAVRRGWRDAEVSSRGARSASQFQPVDLGDAHHRARIMSTFICTAEPGYDVMACSQRAAARWRAAAPMESPAIFPPP